MLSLHPNACVYPSDDLLRDDEYVDVELWVEDVPGEAGIVIELQGGP
jgi:hypothetical protein